MIPVFRLTVQSVWARRGRFLLTAAAVVLGVAFMAGTSVLTGTLRRAYDGIATTNLAATDAVVRAAGSVDGDAGRVRGTLDASIVDVVRRVDGVAAADGSVSAGARLVGRDGKLADGGAHQAVPIGMAWLPTAELNPLRLVAGRAPRAGTEVVIDRASARDAGFGPGDRVTVLTSSGAARYTVSGVATFGSDDDAGGAGVVAFAPAAAARILGVPGRVDAVRVAAAPGVSQAEVARRVGSALAAGGRHRAAEVVTGRAAVEEELGTGTSGVPFMEALLPVFALVALFVGAFVIYNAFSITGAQRVRETAVLRAVGASRGQVRRTVLVEAGILGAVASVAGAALGVALAHGLAALLRAFGVELPGGPMVVGARPLAVAAATGTVVTAVAAYLPARRASKVAPVAAMRDVAVDRTGGSIRRAALGAVLTGVGVVASVSGARAGAAGPVGIGALALFAGVVALGPVVAPRFIRAAGRPLAGLRGVAGELARENAARNPRRTAATASALTIGVALVVLISVFAASARASMDANIDRNLRSDWIITPLQHQDGLGPAVAETVDALPETGSVTTFRYVPARLDGATVSVAGIDPERVEQHLDVGARAGSVRALGATGIGVGHRVATERGLRVGDRVTLRFAETGARSFEVEVVYDLSSDPLGDFVVSQEAFEANASHINDQVVFATTAPGVGEREARTAIERALRATPTARLHSPDEFKSVVAGRIEQLLNLVYVLLFLAVVISLFGIANALALAIVERRREIGLLRAVGMERGQVRAGIRWEAVLVALLGTVAGTALGLGFAWAMVTALAGEGIDRLAVPGTRLVLVGAVGLVGAVVAAALPARRAARLEVLRALTT